MRMWRKKRRELLIAIWRSKTSHIDRLKLRSLLLWKRTVDQNQLTWLSLTFLISQRKLNTLMMIWVILDLKIQTASSISLMKMWESYESIWIKWRRITIKESKTQFWISSLSILNFWNNFLKSYFWKQQLNKITLIFM